MIADHGSFPIERIAVDRGGEGRWVGSAGHEEVLRLTDLKDVFEDEDRDEAAGEAHADEGESDDNEANQNLEETFKPTEPEVAGMDPASSDDEQDSDLPKEKKRKRKQEKDALVGRKKRGRNQVDAEPSFFSGL